MTVVLVVIVQCEPLMLKVYVCLVCFPGVTMLKMVRVLSKCQFFWSWRWCVYLIVRLAIHVMNRAPEETINRKSPSKHARTGMVGAVPTTGGTGTQRGPARCLYGLHTGKGTGPRTAPTPCPVQRPHRSPYGPRAVLAVPVPYRFARMGPVPFWPYQSRTVLPVPAPVPFCPHVALTVPGLWMFAVFDTYQPYLPVSFLPVFDTYQPYLPVSFLPVFDTYQPYLPVSFLPVFDTYQPYLPVSFLPVFPTYQPYWPVSFLPVFRTYQLYLPMSFLQ